MRFALIRGVLITFLVGAAVAQDVRFRQDFETGLESVQPIRRYTDVPAAVTAPPDGLEAAFPPPSGQAALLLTPDSDNYNLASAAAGPVIDRRDPSLGAVTFQARLYLLPSGQFDENNFALLAIDDSGEAVPAERYCRFGYRRNALYFQTFDGAEFSDARTDATLASTLSLPGWHSLSLRFEGTSRIRCFVDGQETGFSPVDDDSIPRVQIGALALSTDQPLLVDDMTVEQTGEGAEPQEVIIEIDGTPGDRGSFYIIDGSWRVSSYTSNAPGVSGRSTARYLQGGITGTAVFAPNVAADGLYEVFVTWPRDANSTDVLYTVQGAAGARRASIDQDGWGAQGMTNSDRWVSLGTHRLAAGASNTIAVTGQPQSRPIQPDRPLRVYADALLLVPAEQVTEAPSDQIRWRRSFAAATEESRTSGRAMVIFAYSERSHGSRWVMENTLTDPTLTAALNRFIPVSVRLDDNEAFAVSHSIARVPTIIVLDRHGQEIARRAGRLSAEEMLALLDSL